MTTPRRIPKWIQITVRGTQEGTERANTFSYQWIGTSSAPSTAQLLAMATAFYTANGTAYKTLCSTSYNLDFVEARWMDPAGPLVAGVYTPSQPNPGTAAGAFTPGNASAVISWKTGILGRKYRGRTYMPAISNSSINGSALLSGYTSNLITLANGIRTFDNGGGANGVQAVVASFVGQVLTPIATFFIDSAVDSMRRRLLNRGR